MSASPKLALVPASRYYCDRCNLVIPQCMCQVSVGLKAVQIGNHDFIYNKVPFFCSKNREYQYFDACCPLTSSCASKLLLLRCNLVIPLCTCQFSLRLKEFQMEAHDFKYNKVPLFARKQRLSILRCLLPRN